VVNAKAALPYLIAQGFALPGGQDGEARVASQRVLYGLQLAVSELSETEHDSQDV
jgi:hypothetical protein